MEAGWTAGLGKSYQNRVPPQTTRRVVGAGQYGLPQEAEVVCSSDQPKRGKRFPVLYTARQTLNDMVTNKDGFMVPVWRVHDCMQKLTDEYVNVMVKPEGKAYFKGLWYCGSVWTCPVCSYTISSKRTELLDSGVEKHNLSEAYFVATLQHHLGSDLKKLLADLVAGVSFMLSGPPARRFREKYQIVWAGLDDEIVHGDITGLEYTFGKQYGHHPHKNILFLSKLPTLNTPEFRADLENLAERYKRKIASKGYLVNEHTTYITLDNPKAHTYLTKWSLELETTQGMEKLGHAGHYTPFQLLEVIGDPETSEEDRAIYKKAFREYAYAFKGRKQLTFGRGLRDFLGLGEDASDEELAQETEEEGEEKPYMFAALDGNQWKQICKHQGEGSLGILLELAERGNEKGFWDYMVQIGAGP